MAVPATDAASGTAPMICTLIAADATLAGRDLGTLRAVHPPVGFGFGSVPRRPSLVDLTTIIESARPPTDRTLHEPAAHQLPTGTRRRAATAAAWMVAAGRVDRPG